MTPQSDPTVEEAIRWVQTMWPQVSNRAPQDNVAMDMVIQAATRNAQGWRTIDSAPLDEIILGYCDGVMRPIKAWDGPTKGLWTWERGLSFELQPTHWQPLPSPPAKGS